MRGRVLLAIVVLMACGGTGVMAQAPASTGPGTGTEDKAEIDINKLKADLEHLKASRESLIANVQATDGAIQYCQKLIDGLEAEKKEAKAKEHSDATSIPSPAAVDARNPSGNGNAVGKGNAQGKAAGTGRAEGARPRKKE